MKNYNQIQITNIHGLFVDIGCWFNCQNKLRYLVVWEKIYFVKSLGEQIKYAMHLGGTKLVKKVLSRKGPS